MHVTFFRHLPILPGGPDLIPPLSCEVIALHKDLDPDAPAHDGYDYFGVRITNESEEEALAEFLAWCEETGAEPLTQDQLISPISFFPEPLFQS
jgi:hypothetical protein